MNVSFNQWTVSAIQQHYSLTTPASTRYLLSDTPPTAGRPLYPPYTAYMHAVCPATRRTKLCDVTDKTPCRPGKLKNISNFSDEGFNTEVDTIKNYCNTKSMSSLCVEGGSTPDNNRLEASPERGPYRVEQRAGHGKRLYGCEECAYTTDRKNNLKRHVATMHDRCTKLLECCDVVFSNKAALRQHVAARHRHGYDCPVCGRTFCRKALLKRHVTVHSGQKDFVCALCGYATSHKSNLDRHKRRHVPKQLRPHAGLVSPPDQGACSPLTEHCPTRCHPLLRAAFSARFDKTTGFAWFLYQQRRIKSAVHAARDRHRDLPRDRPGARRPESPQLHQPYQPTHRPASTSSPPPVSRRRPRMTPALHRCRLCRLVFTSQVDLSNHDSAAHSNDDVTAPKRPLTLTWRVTCRND